MTDKELYQLCKKFGNETLAARRKFEGLLPEVNKRHLYAKKGFLDIYEFAAKLAGISHEQVDLVLGLNIKFEDKPILQKALTSGEISANKLVRIASIATVENQKELYETIKLLSNRAVEAFVRDVKNANRDSGWSESGSENQNMNLDEIINESCGKTEDENGENQKIDGSHKPIFGQKVLHVHFGSRHLEGITLKLDSDVEKELTEMQEKGIDVNNFLREALKKRKENIENEKLSIAEAQRLEQTKRERIGMEPVRYVRVRIRKILREEHGTKCSIPGCQKPAKALHHMQRFSLTKNHDPHFIAPLCEGHHEITHKIDLKYITKTTAMVAS